MVSPKVPVPQLGPLSQLAPAFPRETGYAAVQAAHRAQFCIISRLFPAQLDSLGSNNGRWALRRVYVLLHLRPLQAKHKAEPRNYIEFFLVTGEGREVLAVTAEDHGNAHYVCVRGGGL